MNGKTMRPSRNKFFAALGLTAALMLSFAVSPAAASSGPQVSWDDCEPGFFSGLDALGVSSAARGESLREPGLNQVQEEVPADRRGKGGSRFRGTVPTYVHVVSDGAIGNVSDTAISNQIQVLNMTFGGFEGGTRTGFSFALAGVTRTSNAAWHYSGPGNDERAMKQALHRGGPNALNIYLTTAGPYLGWAYFPSIVKQGNSYLDGIVVDWESMLGTSTRYAGRYDQGETATHEAGHWLNLHHTFNGGCNRWGDYVADTPAQSIATNGCPAGQDSCPEPGLDPIHNYMDYSYDTCYTEFTPGQVARMQDAWLYWRAG